MDLVEVMIVAGGGYTQQGGDRIMGIAALGVAAAGAAGIALFRRRRRDR